MAAVSKANPGTEGAGVSKANPDTEGAGVKRPATLSIAPSAKRPKLVGTWASSFSLLCSATFHSSDAILFFSTEPPETVTTAPPAPPALITPNPRDASTYRFFCMPPRYACVDS